ncbi:hypothetical protein TNCV_316051 [Trichonephila clavipes]|nr:hypothetical protein TNCV_316051 [Trichonephila clavipes]
MKTRRVQGLIYVITVEAVSPPVGSQRIHNDAIEAKQPDAKAITFLSASTLAVITRSLERRYLMENVRSSILTTLPSTKLFGITLAILDEPLRKAHQLASSILLKMELKERSNGARQIG